MVIGGPRLFKSVTWLVARFDQGCGQGWLGPNKLCPWPPNRGSYYLLRVLDSREVELDAQLVTDGFDALNPLSRRVLHVKQLTSG